MATSTNPYLPLQWPMVFLLVSPAQEAWQGCVYWLYSPGLVVRHVTQPYQIVQRSTKMTWGTHRNIEKLGEICTPLLTARPALQKSQDHNRNDAVSLPGRNWPILRSPFVAYYFLISRLHAFLGHASLAHYHHYRVLFNLVLCMCQYCWVACWFGTTQHTVSQLKYVSFPKRRSAHPTDATFRASFIGGVAPRVWEPNFSSNNVTTMAVRLHKLERKSLMRN